MTGVFRAEKLDNDGFITVTMEDRINGRQWVRRIRADDPEKIRDLRKRFFQYMRLQVADRA